MVASILVLLFYMSTMSNGNDFKIVESASGPVRGVGVLYGDKVIYQYRKIPYAKPPVGDLRFRKPVPYGNWTKVLDGTAFGPSCYQSSEYIKHLQNTGMSEDCLHLNIYVPNTPYHNNTMSVMIWIHGGGYNKAQSFAYDATNLVSIGDVIVVTVNYRLGIFGFLSTMDKASRGNYGLWDQRLAMEWVKDNIEAFGGNPYSITIFGGSAGAFSVGLHALNPENQGLFQKVIAESGTGNSPLALNLEPTKYARAYAIHLKCLNDSDTRFNAEILIRCIKGKSAKAIMEAQVSLDVSQNSLGPLNAPVIDHDMIKQHPITVIANSSSVESNFFRSLDVIIGNVNAEGSLIHNTYMNHLAKQCGFNYSHSIPNSILCNTYTLKIANDFFNGNREVAEGICKQYSSPFGIEQSRNIVNMYTDFSMIAPAVAALDCHSLPGLTMGRNTYQYIFSREYIYEPFPQPSWFKGAWHGAEVPYISGPGTIWTISHPVSEPDTMLSETIIRYWTNFAKTGSPNGPGVPYWPRYDSVGRLYQDLNINITPAYHLYPERMRFWNQYIPSLLRTPVNTVLG